MLARSVVAYDYAMRCTTRAHELSREQDAETHSETGRDHRQPNVLSSRNVDFGT